MCLYVLCGYVRVRMSFLQRPGKGIKTPGSEVTDSCEPPGMGAGNQTLVLCKQSKCFFFFFFFFSGLGTKPGTLCFLGKRSTTEPNPQPQSKCS